MGTCSELHYKESQRMLPEVLREKIVCRYVESFGNIYYSEH
jgi:hypothetical protein